MNDVRKDMNKILTQLKKTKSKAERIRLRGDLRDLRKELQQREQKTIVDIVQHANIVLATNVGAGDRSLKNVEFDVAVIDEAAQALEPSCWIPIMKAKKLILAGDHCQLPPTIKSIEAAKEGLAVTLFERLVNGPHGQDITRMLKVQYRMHQDIMEWPSHELYNDQLVAHQSVAQHLLSQLPGVHADEDEDTTKPLLAVDTAGCNLYESVHQEGVLGSRI